MPVSIIASAFALTLASSSSGAHPKAFQPFHPMGGRAARRPSGTAALQSPAGCAGVESRTSSMSSRQPKTASSAALLARGPSLRDLEQLDTTVSCQAGTERPGSEHGLALNQVAPVRRKVGGADANAEIQALGNVKVDQHFSVDRGVDSLHVAVAQASAERALQTAPVRGTTKCKYGGEDG